MKSILVLLGLLLPSVVLASDIYDLDHCQGPAISDEKIVEILGANYEKNIGRDFSNQYGMPTVTLHGRKRIKLNNHVGQWETYYNSVYNAVPIIGIDNDGVPYFELRFYDNGSEIKLRDNIEGLWLEFIGNWGFFADWGSGRFTGKITENCIILHSKGSNIRSHFEMAYFIDLTSI